MKKIFTVVVVALLLTVALATFASAETTVGVKQGDWIEYSVSYTGSPAQGHDVTSARLDIKSVDDANISVIIKSQLSNGSEETINSILNLETGHLIDDFIIPANLNAGDTFKDENLGTVTIGAVETRQYVGASRTVVTSTVGNNSYVWDQATGVSLEGNSQTANYTIHTIVSGTNLWQPQTTPQPGFDFVSIVLVVAFGLIVLVAALIFTARYIKQKASRSPVAN